MFPNLVFISILDSVLCHKSSKAYQQSYATTSPSIYKLSDDTKSKAGEGRSQALMLAVKKDRLFTINTDTCAAQYKS